MKFSETLKDMFVVIILILFLAFLQSVVIYSIWNYIVVPAFDTIHMDAPYAVLISALLCLSYSFIWTREDGDDEVE